MSASNSHDPKPRERADASPPRIGVYVCHCGGNISDVVEAERAAQAAAKLPHVVVSRRDMFMCSDPGQKLIAEDVKAHQLNRVVVAACSPSLHEATFRRTLVRSGLNPYLYEHVNIREQVSWCSKSDPAGATEKAIRLIAAAVAKITVAAPLAPIRVAATPHVAVIGGGISGLRCACDLAHRGVRVTLLESAPFLGGRVSELDEVYPTKQSARTLLAELIALVVREPKVTIHTSAELTEVSGHVGSFRLQVRLHPRGVARSVDPARLAQAIAVCPEAADSEHDHRLAKRKAIYLPYADCHPAIPAIDWGTCTRCGKCAQLLGDEVVSLDEKPRIVALDVGSIVLATGYDHYSVRVGEYGYGQYPQVITLPQLLRLMDRDGPTGGRLTVGAAPIKNICLIHCVGSRQVAGVHAPGPDGNVNDYCSRVCCTATLHAACRIKERYPDLNIYDFYQDIRTYGRGHEQYYENASQRGVLFFRWLAESPPVVEKAHSGTSPLLVRVKDTLTYGEEIQAPADLVVLSSGMVPRDIDSLVRILKLPRSPDRFLQEVHPKLRPVELAAQGVMIAGACQAPMDIAESCAAASAAAVKATTLLAGEHIELDPFVATVDLEACTGGPGCDAACLRECDPLQAISLVEKEVGSQRVVRAEVNTILCKGCGMCVPSCPYGAIQVAGWDVRQYEAMVDAIVADVPQNP